MLRLSAWEWQNCAKLPTSNDNKCTRYSTERVGLTRMYSEICATDGAPWSSWTLLGPQQLFVVKPMAPCACDQTRVMFCQMICQPRAGMTTPWQDESAIALWQNKVSAGADGNAEERKRCIDLEKGLSPDNHGRKQLCQQKCKHVQTISQQR